MKGITNFDSNSPRGIVTKYKCSSIREFEVRYLKSLYNSEYKIIDPIKILVENPKTDKDEYIVEIEEGKFFTYSYGKTLKEAIREIRLLLIDLYEEFIITPIDAEMPILIDTKNFFKKHIQRRWHENI